MPTEHVVLAHSREPSYRDLNEPLPAPELTGGNVTTVAGACVRDVLHSLGLDPSRFGTPAWNPIGAIVSPGKHIVLKPNWVLHYNKGGASLDCLVTHSSVIEAVAAYCALAKPASIVIGDAPVQGCDFEVLNRACGLDAIADRIQNKFDIPCVVMDFRRTVRHGTTAGSDRTENRRAIGDYVLFDMAERSLLETSEWDPTRFRVTMYHPDLLQRTHGKGKHQYLVAREIIEADLVINLPKLKTHRKAGITGALKNLVGINGNKEYLPHHRKGGSAAGGDCYEGDSWFKLQAEHLYDVANRRQPGRLQAAVARSAEMMAGVAVRLGAPDADVEGAWYGNDTVWRMCLDLQRVLRYGRRDASFSPQPQRTVLTITDAIVAGEGEGPLANTPYPAGFLTGSFSPPAAEWVHARLMGFDPEKIPIVREAFGSFPMPLVDFRPSDIVARVQDVSVPASELKPLGRPFTPPRGWIGHCELP